MKHFLFLILLKIVSTANASEVKYKSCGALKVPRISHEESLKIVNDSVDWLVLNLNELEPDEYPNGWNKKFEHKVEGLFHKDLGSVHELKICFIRASEKEEIDRGKEMALIATKKIHEQVSLLLAEKYNVGLDISREDLEQLIK
jgi:hypothetical protein